jgi:hypothetical protein
VAKTLLKPSIRIYAILAREAPFAVVFRRGPSKQVLTISWNTETHEFRMGQWFKGRIYERRCDLSSSGEKLIYFAAKYRSTLYTWTAVSRPPFPTALLLWPKGHAWGGGGVFLREADEAPVAEVAKKHGVSDVTIYARRKRFGKLEALEVKRLRQIER